MYAVDGHSLEKGICIIMCSIGLLILQNVRYNAPYSRRIYLSHIENVETYLM